MTTSQRLTEAELDKAIRSTQERPCDEHCAQGRNHDCQMPEEFPPFDGKSFLVAMLMIAAVVGYCVLVQG